MLSLRNQINKALGISESILIYKWGDLSPLILLWFNFIMVAGKRYFDFDILGYTQFIGFTQFKKSIDMILRIRYNLDWLYLNYAIR